MAIIVNIVIHLYSLSLRLHLRNYWLWLLVRLHREQAAQEDNIKYSKKNVNLKTSELYTHEKEDDCPFSVKKTGQIY